MSEKELYTVIALPIDTDQFRLEIVNRGNEEYAESINDFGILMDLCKKGNKYAALKAARKCLYGNNLFKIYGSNIYIHFKWGLPDVDSGDEGVLDWSLVHSIRNQITCKTITNLVK